MWVVTKRLPSGWEEIVSNEFRLPNHADDFAKKKSKEELGTEFAVCRLVVERTYSSAIVTTTDEVE